MYEMRQELLESSTVKLLTKLSLPGIIGMLVLGLYSLVDAIFVGQMAGSNEVGAIMIAYPFTLINTGIALLIGTGSASILSRAIGKKDNNTVDNIMSNLFVMILVLSFIITILGMIFAKELVSLSGAKGNILDLAVRYLRIIFAGSFFANFAPSANMVIRAEGYMKKAMYIIASGALANVILDPVFIIVFGREYAVEGVAVATVLSYITYSVLTFFYFTRKSKTVKFHRIKISWNIVRETISIGISAALLQLMNLVQQTVVFNLTSQYGNGDQMILIGSALRIITFLAIPLFGMGQGLQPIIGTNYGAGLFSRVKDVTNKFLIAAIILSVCLFLPVILMPELVLSVFIKDAMIVSEGIAYFRQMICIFPAVGVLIIIITFFQALGKGNKAGFLVILRQVVLFIPIAFLLTSLLHMAGIWSSIPITDGIVLVLGAYLLIKEYKSLTSRSAQISVNFNKTEVISMSYKIINIGDIVVNNFVIVTERGCVAMDTGYAGGFKKYAQRLEKNGIHLSDIKYLFLTHAHDDHAGFIKELLDATNATIVLHKDAVDRLKAGQNSFKGGCTSKKALTVCKVLALFGKGKHLFPSIEVSDKIKIVDQDDKPFLDLGLEGRVILLPGHTADSIGLLMNDGNLFCGDAAMNGPGITARHPIFLENLEDHRETWDRIIASEASTIYTSHGKPFPAKDLKRFRHYMDNKILYALKEY